MTGATSINPLESSVPLDPIEQAHDFARDLAHGVATGLWTTRFYVTHGNAGADWIAETDRTSGGIDPFKKFIQEKWHKEPPSDRILSTFGYLNVAELRQNQTVYHLTEKAMTLLQKPVALPTVFISYKRGESSAFALLVEARLRLVGIPNPFLDKSIAAGDQWHALLEDKIKNCKIFVCLVGPEALKSRFVQKEIELAELVGCRIISIWVGCTLDTNPHPILGKFQAIDVKGSSADDYETAISRLLNDMGYSTY